MHVCVIVRKGRKSPLRSAVDLRFRRGSKIMKNYVSTIKENRRLEGSWALLVRFLVSLVRFGGNFSRSWGEDGRKMIEVGARMASRRVLDGP